MIRLLIVGTGGMANTHAEAFTKLDGVTIVAGVDPDAEKLAAFCAKHDVPHSFADIDSALAWGAFDAVANVTPDKIHHRTTLPFLAAGKHVLCEKPLATSHADALEMAKAAQAAGVVNMVNLTYRNGAAMRHAAKMVRDGAIGTARHFEASYLQSWLTQPAWGDWQTEDQWLWRLSTAHGSLGALGDVGVHIVDYATHVAGADVARVSCRLTTFDKAEGGQIGEYTLDANDSFNMHVALENGAVGVIHASRMASGHFNDLHLRIYGDRGGLEVSSVNLETRLRASIGDDMLVPRWVDVPTPEVQDNFAAFIAAIKSGSAAKPDFARGAILQRVLDLAVASDAQQAQDLCV
ncbi:Gfo/Idh/MocA family protein [Yoonia sp. 208BN28-4]|uniref:Gfo/Idh/MocA family protein n=1 Tax=Yoonia sp. 208BN28-4 TaxID=3126505 RepID=UPI0030A98D04